MTKYATCKIENAVHVSEAPAAHPELGMPSNKHVYTDGDGVPVATVFRYDKSDKSAKKEFRPFCHYCHRWHAPDLRPLYYADALKETTGPVVIVEGEKCADALNGLGILVTTVFGSSGGIGKADFSPLRDRGVIIWPDNDEPGAKFADQVALSLREIGAASVRIVQVNDATLREVSQNGARTYTYTLRKGWDAADAINDGWARADVLQFIKNAESLKASEALRVPGRIRSVWNALKGGDPLKDREALKDVPLKGVDAFKEDGPFKEPANDSLKLKAPEWGEPDMSVLNPRPKPPEFPTQLFGPFWSKWISSQAESKSAPVDYVGATLLVSASTAIGNARRVSPWEGWTEPPHLWAALVGNPSSGKSPAMDPVMDLIRKVEADEAEGHADALRQFEADVIAANYVRDQWEKDVKTAAKEGYPAPLKPEAAMEPLKPHRPRLRVSDATLESLMSLLSQLPKGVLMTRDELAGWIGSFNRYAGGEGGDRAFWLEAWGGRSYTVDRVKNGQAITIPHLSIAVLGGIQPDKLASALLKGDDDGLTARFMYFWPDPVPLERPQDVLEGEEALKALRALHGLEMGTDEHGNAFPVTVPLSEEAAAFFHEWRIKHRNGEPEGALLSWWGKMPGVCLRLALTFEGLWNVADGKGVGQVCKQAVEAATVMIDDYLKPMASRAFGDAALTDKERNAAILATWILKNRPNEINSREISRGAATPKLRKAEDILSAFETLERAMWIRAKQQQAGKIAGRHKMDYKINPSLIDA